MPDPDFTGWTSGNWNAFVVLGETRQERRRRLALVPEDLRLAVERHAISYFEILKKSARQKKLRPLDSPEPRGL